MVHDNIILKV